MRLALMKSITLTKHPKPYPLLKEGKSLADFLKLSPQEILLRWLSCELKNASSSRMAAKFTKDLSRSEILTTVLKHIEPECCAKSTSLSASMECLQQQTRSNIGSSSEQTRSSRDTPG
jgi:hypothetical protein